MRIARRTFLASSIVSAAAPAVMRVAYADAAQLTLKLHHAFSAVSSVHDKFLVPWARKVAADSGGRLHIDIFPSMQLGGAPAALFDQARDGVTDIAWTAPSLTPGRFPKIETFELPFLVSSRSLVSSKALADFAAVNLKDEFREVYPLCFSCSDRAVLHATTPIRTIEDIKNLKIHVQTRLVGEAMRELGAHPVPMPSTQLPDALAEHVVDACIDPWHVVPPLRLNDLLRSHTEFSDASPGGRTYVLAMNRSAYDRLPRDLKAVIDSNSGQFAATMAGAMWDLQAAAVANTAVERGDFIVTLLPDAVAHWRKATEPVVEAWRKEMKEQKIDGAKLLLGAHALLAKYANEPQPHPSQPPPSEQQAATQPRAAPQATGEINNAPANRSLSNSASSTPAHSTAAPSGPTAKAGSQPPAPHAATPGSGPGTPPGPAPGPALGPAAGPAPAPSSSAIAKPASPAPPSQAIAPAAPPAKLAAPAPPAAPPPATPPPAAPPPAAPPAAASAAGAAPAAAPPATASIAPAAKATAAPVAAPTPALVPAPPAAPSPSVAAAPPPPHAPPVPKPAPKTVDIPL
jgi:TRAP-type transport system periplasmic protein